MYKIDFYRDKDGRSELQEYIDFLWDASPKSKDAHVQYEQISLQIKLLQENGTNLPAEYTKHLEEESGNCVPAKTGYYRTPRKNV